MILIPIPKRSQVGKCKVRGQECEFRIEGKQLRYRPEGEGQWQTCRIQSVQPGIDIDTYICK